MLKETFYPLRVFPKENIDNNMLESIIWHCFTVALTEEHYTRGKEIENAISLTSEEFLQAKELFKQRKEYLIKELKAKNFPTVINFMEKPPKIDKDIIQESINNVAKTFIVPLEEAILHGVQQQLSLILKTILMIGKFVGVGISNYKNTINKILTDLTVKCKDDEKYLDLLLEEKEKIVFYFSNCNATIIKGKTSKIIENIVPLRDKEVNSCNADITSENANTGKQEENHFYIDRKYLTEIDNSNFGS